MSKRWLATPYMQLIIALGAVICLRAAYHLPIARLDLHYLLLALIAILLSSRFTIEIPRFKSEISISDSFTFLTLLLYGGEAAILLAAAEPLCSSLRICKKWITILFNSAQMVCSTFLTVWVMRALFGPLEALPLDGNTTRYITAISVMALVQYLGNSWIIAVAGAAKAEQPIWQTYKKHYLWSSLTYIAGASAAGLAARFAGALRFEVVLVTVPVIVILYFTYRTYLKNVESAAAQAEQAERHVQELNRYIAERERAETALRESEEKYRLLVENIPDVVWSASQQGAIIFISPNIEQITGFAQAEVYREGNQLRAECIHADDSEKVRLAFDALFNQNKMLDIEYRLRRKDGQWIWVHDKAVSTYEKDGVRYADGLLSDITERRILESQLRQAQKLESIGQLAGGIAHEINTPMQFVGDNTRFLQDAFRDLLRALDKYGQLLAACRSGSIEAQLVSEAEDVTEEADVEYLAQEIPKAVQQSLEGIERVTKIVQSMKDFAHPGAAEKKAADLNQAIESTVTVAQGEWKYIAELDTDLDPTLPLVPCLLGEFNQVILNLIINAAHAIADVVGSGEHGKGRISLSTRRQEDWVEVRVSDTGTGIPEAVRSRIFDPFFTTKEVGRGTGQGLAIAHTVVAEKHGGSISFETEVGKGTTFIVRIPLYGIPEPSEEVTQA